MNDERDSAMDETSNMNTELSLFKKLLPYLALAILLSMSVGLWQHFENLSVKREQRRFNEYVAEKTDSITGRLERYKMVLQGGVGVFIASEQVSRAEWRAYIDYRQIRTLYPGVQGMGFSKVIRPDGERDEYTAIIFLEPFDARNQRTLGYDMFSEPVRRAAMTRARDTGEVSLSGRVTLVQETDQEIEPGFLIYLPVYPKGITPNSPEARRAAIQGYVFASFRMIDFMEGVFPEISHKIDFELYDGADLSPAALMYDSHVSPGSPDERRRPMFTATRTLDLYGHQWTLTFDTTPLFEAEVDVFIPKTILGGGIIISLLIFFMLKMMETAGAKAFSLARKMTAALRESEARYQILNDNLPVGVSLIGPNMEVLAANAVKRRWFPEVHRNTHPLCFTVYHTPPRTEPCEGCPVVLALRDGQAHTADRQAVTSLGERVLRMSALPIKDADGKIIHVHETVEDITERKRAEDDLRASEERYRMLFDQSPVGVVTIDLQSQLPVSFNDMAASQLGYSREEFGRLRISDYEAAENPEQTRSHIERLLQHGQDRFETRHRTKTGEIRNVLVSVRIPSIKGQSLANCVFQDITAEKQAEQERIARQAAEAASRHKSLFLSNMSHEIRTPMNAILGFAQVLERDPSLTPGQREHVLTITRSAHHLLRLIDDILDISKIEAGRIELKPAVFRLGDLLDDVEMLFRSRAEAEGLQLLVERDAGLPAWVRGDEGKLRQILVNLLGNAVKFTESGGVCLRARSEPAADHPDEDGKPLRLVFEVEDSGPGIPASDRERIFGAFDQAEAGARAGGTGLGLAISRRLVEMMGGKLTVESVVGKGSCFRFEVRCERAEAVPETEKPESRRVVGLEPGSGPWRVLVVDDVATNRDLLRALLAPLGFETREAGNGQEAIDLFEEWSPHAVLMDMRMPVMDGYEATRRIKATEAGRATPVIAVTATAFKDSEKEVLDTGVSAYLRKPFRSEELYGALGKFLGLRYVYADEPAEAAQQPKAVTLTPEALAALPRAWCWLWKRPWPRATWPGCRS